MEFTELERIDEFVAHIESRLEDAWGHVHGDDGEVIEGMEQAAVIMQVGEAICAALVLVARCQPE